MSMIQPVTFPARWPSLRTLIWGVMIFFTGAASATLWILSYRPTPDAEVRRDFVNRFSGGTLILSGGGRLPPEIRERFLDLAGTDAEVVVIPAQPMTDVLRQTIIRTWQSVGATRVTPLAAGTRQEAESPEFLAKLKNVNAVWLHGGQQEFFASLYAGTAVEDRLKQIIQDGGVVGGSSAGASVMTKMMIRQGVETAELGSGLDLLPDAIVDQHFLRRNRLNRLVGVLELHPELIGFGIDESTALVVQMTHGHLCVLGESYVVALTRKAETSQQRFAILRRGDQIDINGLKEGATISSPFKLDDSLFE
jgi:cyanophycinase